MTSITALFGSPRFWPRAAVWGGAIASTAMNLSSNWHAHTIGGVTTFIAPTANGLHLPEVTKLVVSAAFPLLLIFAVESAARTSLRFSRRDLGSYAMPFGAITVFLFSVGEVTRLLLGMGQPLPLALLFALAPDVLITAGTVVLMRERNVPNEASRDTVVLTVERPVTVPQDDAVVLPRPAAEDRPVPSRTEREAPVSRPAPTSRPDERDASVPSPAGPSQDRDAKTREAVPSRAGRVSADEALAQVRAYRDEHNDLPSPNWMKQNLGMGHARASRLLANVDAPDGERVELHTVAG
jgi:hypothetical protein